ncbi:RelA/SpoT domain-containing protein [Herminiimonas sp. CN]|uniref:RelA/SpoT domain-containing protein n=1 Tax=Herminiimonas sp. CN TaxID=1349818 RepID=UPI00068539FE|nr:RelA/SpoT domain-containing protein [Herminiimonas sp. CN]
MEYQKYADISIDNYFEKVTDLIGVRVLHLFKNDCFAISKSIGDTFNLVETPVAFIRKGDSSELISKFKENTFEVKEHQEGYRSIHFVAESKPQKLTVVCEIQIRTIFEEGWSEIDHKVRYPNFSDNALIGGYLEIFNRLAGSADDMGGYVLSLADAVSQFDNKILEAKTADENMFVEQVQGLFFGGNFPNALSNIVKKTVSVTQNVTGNPTNNFNTGTLKITVLRDTPIATGTGKFNPVMSGVPTISVKLKKSPSYFDEGMMVLSANTGTTYDFNINMRAVSYKEPLPAGEYEFIYEARFDE